MLKQNARSPRPSAANPVSPSETSLLERIVAESEAGRGAAATARSGHLHSIDPDGCVLFQLEGSSDPPFPVSIGLDLSDGAIVKAVRQQRRALVIPTADPVKRWVLVGMVRERVSPKARDAGPGRLEWRVDGERICVDAEHDLELRCGRARITLRYDGRIELRGTHILSASRGPNRIKGATVALN